MARKPPPEGLDVPEPLETSLPKLGPLSPMARLAWLPIPLILAAIVTARAAGMSQSYQNEALRLIFSFSFYTVVSLATLFLIGRSFLASGSPGLLLLECGVVLWSLAGTVGDVFDDGDQNINVTIFNTTILLAGLCHLAGVVLSSRVRGALRARGMWLAASCGVVLGSLALITWAATSHWLPVFFVPGQGGTAVRYCVLTSATAMFALSALLLYAGQRRERSPFTSWYIKALLLLAVGLLGIMIQLSLWSVVNWLARTAQWLGGVYLLLAAIAAMRQSSLPLISSAQGPRPAVYRAVLAMVIVLAAAAVRLVFLQALGMRAPFIIFYPAVIVAALYGGWRSGLLAAVLGAVLADYFWIEPAGQLASMHPADWLSLAIFMLSSATVVAVAEAMLRARARASAAEAQALLAAQREAAAEAVRRSEERLRLQMDRMPIGCIVHDRNNRFTEVNPAAERIFGYSEAELCGQPISMIVPQAARAHVDDVLRRLVEGDMAAHSVNENITKDGRTILCDWTNTPLRDANGAFVGFLSMVQDVTEGKRAEEALRQSREDLDRAQAVGQIGCWRLNTRENVLTWSDENYRIFGIPKGTPLTYEAFLAAVHSDDRKEVDTRWNAALRGEPYDIEHRIVADGAVKWVREKAYLEFDGEGRLLGGFGITQDITARKQTEAALRESEARYRSLFNNQLDGFAYCQMLLDKQGRPEDFVYLEVNDAFTQLTGLADVVGKKVTEIFPGIKEQNPELFEVYGRVAQTGNPERFEIDFRPLALYLSVSVYSPAKGYFVAVFDDITGRKRAEEALAAAHQQLQSIIDNTTSMVYACDLEERFVMANAPLAALLKTTPEQMIGKRRHEFMPHADADAHEANDRDVIAAGRAVELEEHSDLHGRSITWLSTKFPLRDAQGRIWAVAGIITDITARKLAEESLRRTAEELARSNKELEQFAYVASHDLQEPLRQITGFGNRLGQRYGDKLDETAKQYITFMTEGSRRMSNLVHALLDFSRIGRGDQTPRPVSAEEAFRGALENLSAAIEEAGARVTHDVLPTVLAHPVELGQLFQNLLANALKFRREGVTPEAHVGCRRDGQTCTFWVKDNGIGMPSDQYENAFVIFRRVHGDAKYRGTGIGLSICKKIVERLGGRIWVESVVGEGTTFFFTMPLAKEGEA